MPSQNLFQSILAFLNFSNDAPVGDIRKFLQDEGLCQGQLMLGDGENTLYSLYTKAEIETRKAQGEYVSLTWGRAKHSCKQLV